MIKRLRISNFRSIQTAEVAFSPTGLTVVIGANGSGKSNLIKCLEFISAIARDGLEPALYTQRKMEALVPKAMPKREARSARVSISYDFEMWRPTWYHPDLPPLIVHHSLVLAPARSEIARVERESLKFNAPLLVQALEQAQNRGDPELQSIEVPLNFPESWIEFSRSARGKIEITADPPITAFRKEYLSWLGLSFLGKSLSNDSAATVANTLRTMLTRLHEGPSSARRANKALDSWITVNSSSPLMLCAEANSFRNEIAAMRRYDFQLTELRREQEIRGRSGLSVEGRGLPSLIRTMRNADSEDASWSRVANTLHAVAPHIIDASVSQLKSGKEFIEFLESRTGRPVESWESSDGTLRTLAILLALESHPRDGAILIEEPEQGLHPWAVRTLVGHIREVIATRRIQVILTTHSQQLLDSVEPDEVIVASRTNNAGTLFRTLHEILPQSDIEMGDVGRLWVQGLLGGVPDDE